MENTANKNTVIKSILEDLNSGSVTKIKKALKALQVNGDASVVYPIVNLLKSNVSDEINLEIVQLLSDLKDTSVKSDIISILNNDDYISIRQQLLTSIWNCKIDYSEFIADFVGIACESNFMEAFECLTVLENLEGPFEERHILECQLHLKEYIESNKAVDEQKSHVMSEIAQLIKSFDLDTDD